MNIKLTHDSINKFYDCQSRYDFERLIPSGKIATGDFIEIAESFLIFNFEGITREEINKILGEKDFFDESFSDLKIFEYLKESQRNVKSCLRVIKHE